MVPHLLGKPNLAKSNTASHHHTTNTERQVIEVTDGADPREQRIALSMKLVNQADGKDLDPSNAEAETDVSTLM